MTRHNKKIYQIPNQCELPASQIREIKYAIRTAVAIFSVSVMGCSCFISLVMRFTSNSVFNVSSLTIYENADDCQSFLAMLFFFN